MTTSASPVLGRPVWFELMTTDTKAAEAFYDGGRLDVGAVRRLAEALHAVQAQRRRGGRRPDGSGRTA